MGLKDFNGAGCILADDMGLGKVRLSFYSYLIKFNCMSASNIISLPY
jgi:hypothetical protein